MDDATKAAIAEEVKNQLVINGKTIKINSWGQAAWGVVCIYAGASVIKYGWQSIKSSLG